MISAKEAVANGVVLLDKEVPGWHRVIKLEELDMSDCVHCMLGQLFGHDVETALGATTCGLPIDPELAAKSYFNLIANGITEQAGYVRGLVELRKRTTTMLPGGGKIGCSVTRESAYTYADLKCAWAEVIAERRAAEEGEGDEETQ